MVTRRKITPQRRATPQRASTAPRVAGRRRRRSRKPLLIGMLVVVVASALGVGLSMTYVEQTRLEAPSKVQAKPLTPTSVELDWAEAANADSYVVKVGLDRALTDAVTTKVSAKGTRLTVSDLATTRTGGDQFYRVDAVKDGKVRSSRTGRFTLKPDRVRGLDLERVTAGGVEVSWRRTPNARQFDVTIARDRTFRQRATTVRTLGNGRTFVTDGLRPDTTYFLKVRAVNGEEIGRFTKPLKLRTDVRESSFRVGTWNVCSEKCSGYAARAQVMASFIDANKIDIFGLQEAGGKRVGATTNAIFSGRSQGYVRASGGARARYIFYRPAMFEQLSGGSFPIGDGRDTTWGRFRIKKTGREFFFVDVHVENGKSGAANAKRAREMSAMLGRMAAINDGGLPMVYAGDFNSGRHRSADAPGTMMRSAGFGDAYLLTKDTLNGDISTSHTFSPAILRAAAHVDHIWVSKEFDVEQWAQLVRVTGSSYTQPVVSDHNLLSADIALDAQQKSIGKVTPTTTVQGLDASLP